MSRIAIAVSLVLSLFAASASSQVLYAYDLVSPGVAFETYLPSAAYPTGLSGVVGPVPIPANAGMPLPFPSIAGGAACNQVTGDIYTSNGMLIAIDPNAAVYGPFTTLPPSTPPSPVIAPPPGYRITGLAFDSAASVLWATDGVSITALPPIPPFVAGPSIPLGFLPAGSFLTGLGYHPVTGNLWGTTMGGTVYEFTAAGALVSGPFAVLTVGPVGGLAVNTTNSPFSFAPPACSPQVGGYHVCIGDGSNIYDVLTGSPPIPSPFTTPNGIAGLAFSPDYQKLYGTTSCLSTGAFPIAGTESPVLADGGLNGACVAGAPPSIIVDGLLDLCPIPLGGVFVPGTGETLWINPFSGTATPINVVTNAAGLGCIPFSIPAGVFFSGIQFSFQWFVTDGLHPLGLCLSDAATVTVGLP